MSIFENLVRKLFRSEEKPTEIIDDVGNSDVHSESGVNEQIVSSPKSTLGSSTGDPYVDSCLTLAYSEMDDGREWNEYQELLQLPRLSYSPSKYKEFLALADSFKEKYRDFDHLYFWIAGAHRNQKHYDMARQTLLEGLQVCRRKYNLCSDVGMLEFDEGNIAEAVRWWIQSLLLQESHEEFGNHDPFLHLAYLSQPFELKELSDRLRIQCDRINPTKPRLVPSAADNIFELTLLAQEESQMRRALEILDRSDLKFGK